MILLVLSLFGILSLFIPLVLQQGENLSLLDVKALEYKMTRLFKRFQFISIGMTPIGKLGY